MKQVTTILMIGLALLCFSSCSNTDSPNSSTAKKVVIDATNQGRFVYLSLKTGKLVNLTDEEASKSLDWDIAFRANYPRTNGGTSGIGKGGVLKTTKTKFEEVTNIPADANWVEDSMVKIPKVDENGNFIMPPKFENTSANDLLKSWLASGGRPPHKYDNSIFLVKTANGDVAKVQLLSYEKEGKSGYITMLYEYPFK